MREGILAVLPNGVPEMMAALAGFVPRVLKMLVPALHHRETSQADIKPA